MKKEVKIVYFEEGAKLLPGSVLVTPNMVAYIRDVLDVGPIGAVVKRFLKLPPVDMLKLGLRNLPNLPKIAAKDFASGLLILAEIELLRTKAWRYETIILVDQVTDLGIAYSNYLLFDRFIRLAHAYGKKAGVWTNNFGPTVTKLGAWRLKPDLFVSNFNKDGYLMNPDKKSCLKLLEITDVPVWTIDSQDFSLKVVKKQEIAN